jgi:hypothetical protein
VMPETGVRPQDAINRQLVADCELLLGMFWTKLGTSTDVADSGTVEEIDQFVRTNRPAMLYFSRRPIDPTKMMICSISCAPLCPTGSRQPCPNRNTLTSSPTY